MSGVVEWGERWVGHRYVTTGEEEKHCVRERNVINKHF